MLPIQIAWNIQLKGECYFGYVIKETCSRRNFNESLKLSLKMKLWNLEYSFWLLLGIRKKKNTKQKTKKTNLQQKPQPNHKRKY